MKRQIIEYVRSLGGAAHYAGNTLTAQFSRTETNDLVKEVVGNVRTMFITDNLSEGEKKGRQSIEECVLNKFGFGLPFKLVTNA